MSSEPDRLVNERFAIRDQLGCGAMGTVYRAYDRERDIEVALKVLRHVDGATVYRFKKEFRALADIVHPGLVTLHEMQFTGEDWFFTMELVEGVGFLEYVRPHLHLATDGSSEKESPGSPEVMATATMPTRPLAERSAPSAYRRQLVEAEVHLDRLRAALRQLVVAVKALHDNRKLHRDIKPSNVLVTAEGRVVLCDFGLIVEAAEDDRTRDDRVVGTPSYMSPEQAANWSVAEPSDWYSVGVMLYEALTGRLPHEVAAHEALVESKLRQPVRPPQAHNPEAPADLAELSLRLLGIEPSDRPTGEEILEALGAQPPVQMPVRRVRTASPHFVGRGAELDALENALVDMRGGSSVAVFVHGLSGMGKTALVRRFLDAATRSDEVVVLEGRCYEREAVPYKALDAIVDALSSYLCRCPRDLVHKVIPRDVLQLSRLFPALRRVEAVANPRVRTLTPPDPHESRRMGFAALRDLLKRLAELQSVVIWIDDLQWGDLDSAPFLTDLIQHPGRPELLLVVSYRREDLETSPLLQTLRRRQSTGVVGDVREIAVDEFGDDDAIELVQALSDEQRLEEAQMTAIVREARGHPFFLAELAHEGRRTGPVPKLADLLSDRVAALSSEARALLAAIAVSGRPVPAIVAGKAAGLQDETAALTLLRTARLVRIRQAEGRHELECYHDKIRESVVAGMSPEALASCHLSLARVLETSDRPDYQALVTHFLGAGEEEAAGRNALRAARRAERTLAFDRAAHYYGLALDLLDLPEEDRRATRTRLGNALTHAGDLVGAAKAYLLAAQGAERGEELELRRRAVENFLRGGQLETGLREAEVLLREVGLKMPRSARQVLAGVVSRRIWLGLRGLRFKERSPEAIDIEKLRRIDVCWSMSSGLCLVDPLFAMDFQMRHLLTALRAGEAHNVATALGLEVGFRGTAGGSAWTRLAELDARARELAERIRDPHAEGLVAVGRGMAAYCTGHWRAADEAFTTSDRIFREQCTNVAWELGVSRNFRMAALLYQGKLAELTRMVPLHLREALDRGDEFTASGLRSWRSNAAWLAMDLPDEARSQVDAANIHLAEDTFHLHHYYDLLSRRQIDIYTGDGKGAWEELANTWEALEKSTLQRVQLIRIELHFLRARCAFAAADAGLDEEAMLRAAEQSARRIAKEHMFWGEPHVPLIRATIAARRVDIERATAELRAAAEGFDAASMQLLAAVTRYRLGALLGGDEGASMVSASDEWMREQRVKSPERMAALYAPGFPGT